MRNFNLVLKVDLREAPEMMQLRGLKHIGNDLPTPDSNATTRPAEVGWRNVPPMWSIPPNVLRSSNDNITFGMSLTHIDPDYYKIEAILAQCPIVCFKASTVLQGIGVIASKTFLPRAPPLLAHECVIPVICNTSNKNHPACACAFAPSAAAIGLIIPLSSYNQPKVERAIRLDNWGRFENKEETVAYLNEVLAQDAMLCRDSEGECGE